MQTIHPMRRALPSLSAAGFLAVFLAGHATMACASPFSISTVVGGVPGSGSAIDLGALPLGDTGGTVGGVTFGFTGNAQVVQGSAAGVYAAPYASGSEGTFFGGGNGAVGGNYLTAGNDLAKAGSGVAIGFSVPQIAFGLLWGSIDTYNKIQVFNGSTLVGTVTETPPIPSQPGNQGAGGSAYVQVASSTAFNRLVFSSDGWAFEFADLTSLQAPILGEPPANVPEPGTLPVLGAGLALLGLVRYVARRGKRDRRPFLTA